MGWEKEGLNYWENEDCPRDYLEKSLIDLFGYVEGSRLPNNYFSLMPIKELRDEVGFYEYLSDK